MQYVEGAICCMVRRDEIVLGERRYLSKFLSAYDGQAVLVKVYTDSNVVHVYGLDGVILCCAELVE